MLLPDIVIYSKPGCCLCDQAKAQLASLRQQQPFNLREINILEDSSTYKLYKDEIPVIFINGREAFKYRLDEAEFVRLLNSENPERGEAHIAST